MGCLTLSLLSLALLLEEYIMAGTTISVKRQWGISSSLNAIWAFYKSINNIITDLETLRAPLAQSNTLIEELHDDGGTRATWETEVDADLDEINDMLDFLVEEDGVIGGDYAFSDGAAVALTCAGSVIYRIGGETFYKTLPATVSLEDEGDVATNKYRAWRIEIDRLGALTCLSFGDMEKTTAEEALLSLCALALTADTATLGYIVFNDETGAFNIGTTNIDDSENFAVYYERQPRNRASALTAAMGASIAAGSTPENYSTGTRDYMVAGVRVAQDAAESDKTFNDADTIGQSQFGGHLIVTNLANNATYALGSDGLAESVSAMVHASAAAADTQLDLLAARLPSMFCLCGKIVVTNNIAGGFTYGTDDINTTDGTAVFTDVGFATHDRTVTDAIQLGRSNPPVIPGTISAPVTPGPGSSKPTSSGVNAASDLVAAAISTIESGD